MISHIWKGEIPLPYTSCEVIKTDDDFGNDDVF